MPEKDRLRIQEALTNLDVRLLVNSPQEWGGYTPLHLAVRHNDREIIQRLLDFGANINARICHPLATPLHVAAAWANSGTAILLLRNGADTNKHASSSPLHVAVKRDKIKMVELLVDAGADCDFPDPQFDLRAPLHEARSERVARILVWGGANQVRVSKCGLLPRDTALFRGDVSVFNYLAALSGR